MVRASDAELLALSLAAGRPEQTHHSHAIRLLAQPDGLRTLFRRLNERTLNIRDADDIGLIGLAAALELQRRWHWAQLRPGITLSSPNATADYLQSWIGGRGREVFAVIFLDSRHRVICSEELFLGTIDCAQVHPRVVAERALILGAAAIIAAHNHPSGINEPSLADRSVTQRLGHALALLDIRLLDHLILGAGQPVSMAKRGLLQSPLQSMEPGPVSA